MSNSYQVIFYGSLDERKEKITEQLGLALSDLGLPSDAIKFISKIGEGEFDPWLPVIAIFLGYKGANGESHPEIDQLLDKSELVITAVSELTEVSEEIPKELQHINALALGQDDEGLNRITSLVLEGFRLLRRERKMFISYKRDDSQAVANQLYDALDARGFDVFIDIRSVPPGQDFQAELWHRLSDSDVVVLIDTPGFRKSRWTTEELARANATNIQILHLLWPDQQEDDSSAFSYFLKLDKDDFQGKPTAEGQLTSNVVETVCNEAEKLRARAIAARHRYLVDSFCDSAEAAGFSPSVQPQRWVSISDGQGKDFAIVPTIGVPTSDRINWVFNEITRAEGGKDGIWVLYDNRGIIETWLAHLQWLDEYLPVRSVTLNTAEKVLLKSIP